MGAWYSGGLRFSCTGCGRCCGGAPGVVWVDKEELKRICDHVSMAVDDMWGRVIKRVGVSRISLIERSNGDCVFLSRRPNGGKSCSIYHIRPQQCRTWPFWNSNLRSRSDWDFAASTCQGMDQGRLYSFHEIEAVRQAGTWYLQSEGERREAAG